MGFTRSKQSNRRKQQNRRKNKTRQSPSWGYQLIIDASQCDPEAIRSKTVITAFVHDLVQHMHMVSYGKPRIVRFDKDNRMGVTLVYQNENIDISGQFVERIHNTHIDIFSQTSFNPATVLNIVASYFLPRHTRTQFLRRQKPTKAAKAYY